MHAHTSGTAPHMETDILRYHYCLDTSACYIDDTFGSPGAAVAPTLIFRDSDKTPSFNACTFQWIAAFHRRDKLPVGQSKPCNGDVGYDAVAFGMANIIVHRGVRDVGRVVRVQAGGWRPVTLCA